MKKTTLLVGGALAAALIVGTSGGAYAAAKITGADIVNGTVTSDDIKNGSILSRDIKNGSLSTNDLSAHAKAALKGSNGADGTNGVDGKDGKDGTDGVDGVDGVDGKDFVMDTYVVQSEFNIPAGASNKADHTVSCNTGDRLLSGGFSSNDHNNHWSRIYQSRMDWSAAAVAAAQAAGKANDAQPDGWYVQALGGDDASTINLWAYCLAS